VENEVTRCAENNNQVEFHDVIVIGAGINGIYQLHTLVEAGFDVVTLEAGSGVGGTWYWNRYPGARLDSECYSYGYHFDRSIIEDWDWPEHFADQPTLERYFNFTVDRLDLRKRIVFGAEVVRCDWSEPALRWRIQTADGRQFECTFLLAASGIMTKPNMPVGLDLERFSGSIVHSARWPEEGVALEGRRVGVVGVGSTGIQIVQSVAEHVESLTVYQRTANWATPLNNRAIDRADSAVLKSTADEIYANTMASRMCFLHTPQDRTTWDVSPEERLATYERLYAEPGMSLYQGGFSDVFTDQAANDAVVEFLTGKIYQRVDDPEVARKLIPDHGYGMRRPPLETGYYEVYNRPNVRLVHLPEEPIVAVDEAGVHTTAGVVPLDVLILATGFDAITGSFMNLGVHGSDGTALSDWWDQGPRSWLGIFVHRFPNFFIVGGPQGVNGNHPRCAKFVVEWITNCLRSIRERGIERIEVTPEPEEAWVRHCNELVGRTLMKDARSWAWGSNVVGKPRAYTLYLGSQPEFRELLGEIEADGYAPLSQSSGVRSAPTA
jgi:cation diffusion facilitator CzcD-associated flavoprotein CzcO